MKDGTMNAESGQRSARSHHHLPPAGLANRNGAAVPSQL